ncbi:MAG TPA: hypothetical protein VGJ28_20360 [Micromonosporaceae bacterium]|jgi:hypothetical protein
MGQVVKQMSSHSTRYIWYPGDKKEWLRGVLALVAGAVVYALLHLLTRNMLFSAVVGTSTAAGLAGFNFGRRDSRELARFAEISKSKYVRRQTAVHTGRAVWRGVAEGTGGAAAAVIIVNLSERGVLADWLLPLVPAVIGALTHQIGMMYERLGTSESTEGPAKRAAAQERVAPASGPSPEPATARHAADESQRHVAAEVPDKLPAKVPAATTVPATTRARGTARVPSLILSAAAAGKLQPVPDDPAEPSTLLRFDPVADCGTVAAAREKVGEKVVADGGDRRHHTKPSKLSPHHAAVALPPSVSTFKHGKPPMPLSAALAARGDLAHIANALGTESLTESRKYSAK